MVFEDFKSEQTAQVKKEKIGCSLPFNVLMLKQDRRKDRDREQKKTVKNQQDQVATQGTHHVNQPHEEDKLIPNP
ncbi:hypothetical protein P6709_20300, partial [Jeotgalibacillus sp. ET6]|uniref:hypothetical protein n=1 Tax=Jeotgalibacillus sp. ET6 TaxID=3037260 RepID=UPI0024187171